MLCFSLIFFMFCRCHQVFGIVSKREMAAHSSHNFPSSIFTSIYRKGASFLPGRQMEKLSQTHFMNRFKTFSIKIFAVLFHQYINLNQITCFLPFLILQGVSKKTEFYQIELLEILLPVGKKYLWYSWQICKCSIR